MLSLDKTDYIGLLKTDLIELYNHTAKSCNPLEDLKGKNI